MGVTWSTGDGSMGLRREATKGTVCVEQQEQRESGKRARPVSLTAGCPADSRQPTADSRLNGEEGHVETAAFHATPLLHVRPKLGPLTHTLQTGRHTDAPRMTPSSLSPNRQILAGQTRLLAVRPLPSAPPVTNLNTLSPVTGAPLEVAQLLCVWTPESGPYCTFTVLKPRVILMCSITLQRGAPMYALIDWRISVFA